MSVLSLYVPHFATVVVYMLQSTEYQPRSYLAWFWRTNDFGKVMKRRVLEPTRAARILLLVLRVGMLLQVMLGLAFLWLWYAQATPGAWQFGVALLISYPVAWAHLIVVPLILGRIFIIAPKEKRLIHESKAIFAQHPAEKIAVAGSYGKTTMKELLGTVLAEGKKVAITPANKNVASSHAVFAAGLTGNEDVLVIEYGEGAPGDVVRFAETTQPTYGVITGLAPAHLDQYPSLKAAGEDIFSLAAYLHHKHVFVNGESDAAHQFIRKQHTVYSASGADGWKVSKVSVGFEGVSFTLAHGKEKLQLRSGLLGRHQIGPLVAVALIAKQLGLTNTQIAAGIAKTAPFEHRMQPRHVSGAWILDDTYNGNIDGLKAGLALLKELPAKRRIYVTPGLVDQGIESQRVHNELGRSIAQVAPDVVYLMENSATDAIKHGMKEDGFSGELRIESDPLEFYTNIEHYLAAGDVVLMQNDWTDNYH